MQEPGSLNPPGRWRRKTLRAAVESVPPGRWGVAVSGGADSVALLRLLWCRASELRLTVIHVNHQLRSSESDADARFVASLAVELGLPFQLFTREQLEAVGTGRPDGAGGSSGGSRSSAQLRDLRLCAYREAAARDGLDGVILAHHCDDLAETIFMRLLRGSPRSGTLGLSPLRVEQTVRGVRMLRPLLGVRRHRLRRLLSRIAAEWREDPSNLSSRYRRNRVRALLADRPRLVEALLSLKEAAACAEAALEAITPSLDESPRLETLIDLAMPVRRRALRRWLVRRGVEEDAAGPRAIDAILAMLDAAGPRAAQLSGSVIVRRTGRRIVVVRT